MRFYNCGKHNAAEFDVENFAIDTVAVVGMFATNAEYEYGSRIEMG